MKLMLKLTCKPKSPFPTECRPVALPLAYQAATGVCLVAAPVDVMITIQAGGVREEMKNNYTEFNLFLTVASF